MNRVVLKDLTTGEASPVLVAGLDGVRQYFKGDVKGKTLSKLGDNTYLRKWTACDQLGERGIAIYDAYDGKTLEPVDLVDLPDASKVA